jgi:hypothetical protein
MLTKAEFLAALRREAKILNHLAGRLDDSHLGFRFTPPQRSTLDLLRYLTIAAEANVRYHLNGNWDHWDALEAATGSVTLATFPAALQAQQRRIAALLKPISDRAFARMPVRQTGGGKGTIPLATALGEHVLARCVGYRMQLFLQAKAAGLADLRSSDLWHGRASA